MGLSFSRSFDKWLNAQIRRVVQKQKKEQVLEREEAKRQFLKALADSKKPE